MTEHKSIDHQRLELRVKRVTLGLESVVIKAEEQRLKRRLAKARARLVKQESVKRLEELFAKTYLHRVQVVRPEARANHIASSFLRGTPYFSVENPDHTRTEPDWKRVKAIVRSFSSIGDNELTSGLIAWAKGEEWSVRQAIAERARVGQHLKRAEAHRQRRAEKVTTAV